MTCTERCVSTFVCTLQICWIVYDCVLVATPSNLIQSFLFFLENVRRDYQQGVCVSYRVERLAAGRPLGSVGDALRSSASEPARHPPGDTVPPVLLQHLQMGGKEEETTGSENVRVITQTASYDRVTDGGTVQVNITETLFIQGNAEGSIFLSFMSSGWIISV